MRLYYVVHDQSAVKQTPGQRQAQLERWRSQPFVAAADSRASGPNEQPELLKWNPAGEYGLGGIDLENAELEQVLDSEASKIDARFRQIHRQLELVLLKELRDGLSPEDSGRAGQLSVLVVAHGPRDEAIAGVQTYLRTQAAVWYTD